MPDGMGFVHLYSAPRQPGARTLLLLHGTGGDEQSLLAVGRFLDPNAGLLSLRGNVLEGTSPRFFQRLAPQVLDLEDLRVRTIELADFLKKTAEHYGFDPDNVVAVGYSNGANIAASTVLRYPKIFSGAILFHGVLPFMPEALPDLSGTRIFITEGERDSMISRELVFELSETFRAADAATTLNWHVGGHELTRDEIFAAHEWLKGQA